MINAINSALTGLTTAGTRLNPAATRIAHFGTDNDSVPPPHDDTLSHDLVSLQTSKHLYTANAAVLKTADQMLGTLLDTLDTTPHDHRSHH